MKQRKLGVFSVGAVGFGCMNLSHGYGDKVSPEQAERILLGALDAGYTLFDTATLYGFGANETLLGRYLKPHRDRFVLSSKCVLMGVDRDNSGKMVRVIDGRPETIRACCEASLRRLQTDVIDLYYLHRLDPKVPIEDSVGAMRDLVQKGHIRSIGLSEMSAATLRRAHAVHPITAVQSEYSLWTRNPEIAVLQACQDLGVTFVAFSPVARGFLCGLALDPSSFVPGDLRLSMPRFQGDNYVANQNLLPAYHAIAQEVGYTPAQLALAWVLAQGDFIVPIPGSTKLEHLRENAQADRVELRPEVLKRLDALINQMTVRGPRYNEAASKDSDTENFA